MSFHCPNGHEVATAEQANIISCPKCSMRHETRKKLSKARAAEVADTTPTEPVIPPAIDPEPVPVPQPVEPELPQVPETLPE